MTFAGHCSTCRCASRTDAYCSAELVRGHERFGCLEFAEHRGPHKGSCVPPPCPTCGGLEDHSEDCVTPDLMADEHGPWIELIWDDDA